MGKNPKFKELLLEFSNALDSKMETYIEVHGGTYIISVYTALKQLHLF